MTRRWLRLRRIDCRKRLRRKWQPADGIGLLPRRACLRSGSRRALNGRSIAGLSAAEIEEAGGSSDGGFCGVADQERSCCIIRIAEGRRVLSLLPDWHLCVLRASQVVETLPEYFARFTAGTRAGDIYLRAERDRGYRDDAHQGRAWAAVFARGAGAGRVGSRRSVLLGAGLRVIRAVELNALHLITPVWASIKRQMDYCWRGSLLRDRLGAGELSLSLEQ